MSKDNDLYMDVSVQIDNLHNTRSKNVRKCSKCTIKRKSLDSKNNLVKVEKILNSLPDEDSGFLISSESNSFSCPKCNKDFCKYKTAFSHYMKCKGLKMKRKLVSFNDIEWICLHCHFHCENLKDLTLHKKSCVKPSISMRFPDVLQNYSKECRYSCFNCSFACLSVSVFQNHSCEKELKKINNCYVRITKLDIDVANYRSHNKQNSEILTTSDDVNNLLEPIYNTEKNYLSQSQLQTCGNNDSNNDRYEAKYKCEFCVAYFFNHDAYKKHCKKHTSKDAASTADLPSVDKVSTLDETTDAKNDLQNNNFNMSPYQNKFDESDCYEANKDQESTNTKQNFLSQVELVSSHVPNAASTADHTYCIQDLSQAETVSSHVPDDSENNNLDIEPHLKRFYCECNDIDSSNTIEKDEPCQVCIIKYTKVCEFYRISLKEHQQAAACNVTPDVSGYLDNLVVSNAAATSSSNVTLIKSKELIDIDSVYTHSKYLQFLRSLVNLKTNFPPESNTPDEALNLTDQERENIDINDIFTLPPSMIEFLVMNMECFCPMDQYASEDERDLMAFKQSIHIREVDDSDDFQPNRRNKFVWKLNCPFYKVMSVLIKLESCDMCVHIFTKLLEIRVTWQIAPCTKYSAFMTATSYNFFCGICLTDVPLNTMLNHFISSHDENIINLIIGDYKDVLK